MTDNFGVFRNLFGFHDIITAVLHNYYNARNGTVVRFWNGRNLNSKIRIHRKSPDNIHTSFKQS